MTAAPQPLRAQRPAEPSAQDARTHRKTRLLSPPAGDASSRVLTVRFDRFAGALISLGDPDEHRVAKLKAGADLLGALSAESLDFGAAAPAAREAKDDDDDDNNAAQRILALTDEAFAGAHALLEGAEGEEDHPDAVLARACLDAFGDGEGSFGALAFAVLGAPTVPEAASGGGFL